MTRFTRSPPPLLQPTEAAECSNVCFSMQPPPMPFSGADGSVCRKQVVPPLPGAMKTFSPARSPMWRAALGLETRSASVPPSVGSVSAVVGRWLRALSNVGSGVRGPEMANGTATAATVTAVAIAASGSSFMGLGPAVPEDAVPVLSDRAAAAPADETRVVRARYRSSPGSRPNTTVSRRPPLNGMCERSTPSRVNDAALKADCLRAPLHAAAARPRLGLGDGFARQHRLERGAQ